MKRTLLLGLSLALAAVPASAQAQDSQVIPRAYEYLNPERGYPKMWYQAPGQEIAMAGAQSGVTVNLPQPETPSVLPTIPTRPRSYLGAPVVNTPGAKVDVPPPPMMPEPMPPAHGQGNGKCNKFSVFGDYLYWNVHSADVPFAQAFDGIDPVLSVPRGGVGTASPSFHSGFRVGAGAALCENVWLVSTFTYFRMASSAQITAPDGLVLHNFLVFPNTVNSAVDSLTSRADYSIRLYMGDLDAKFALCNTECFSLNIFGGARYAYLNQSLFNTFQLTGASTVDSQIKFDGVGPRIGLDGQYRTRCGVYGYASGIFDVLFGEFRGTYTQQNVFGGVVGQTAINSTRAVPILEMEIGAGWRSCNGRWGFSGGYYVGSWFNTMTTTSFSRAIGNTNFTTNGDNFRDNLIFNGLVARFEFRF